MLTLQSSPRVAVEEEKEGNTLVVRGVTQLDEVVIIAIHCNLIYLMFVCFDDSFFQASYTCSVSAFKKTEVKHSLTVRGESWCDGIMMAMTI